MGRSSDAFADTSMREYRAFAGVASAAIAAAVILQVTGHEDVYTPYLDSVNPLLVLIGAAAVGLFALWTLRPHGFAVAVPGGIRFATLVAVPAATVVMLVDFTAGIPVHNVPWPWSLAFYLSIAFVVEVLFHLVPLAALLGLSAHASARYSTVLLGATIVVVSLIEPVFQAAVGQQSEAWLVIYIWVQVWAVNLAQLIAFRRYGFVSMIAVRLIYYALWHVAWGLARLHF